MGMAASQARYLALVARKTNCEYQGQQINQARLNLANKTATLFNQMLGLNVPVPPSVQDFTITQYSFTDGINGAVIDKWEQLSRPDDDGNNYVVEYHYNANVYTGFQKKMNDPQVQFKDSVPVSDDFTYLQKEVKKIWDLQRAYEAAQKDYDTAQANWTAMQSKGANLATYRDIDTYRDMSTDPPTYKAQWTNHVYDRANNIDEYRIWEDGTTTHPEDADDADYKYICYDNLDADTKATVDALLKTWQNDGIQNDNKSKVYYCATNQTIAFKEDLEKLKGIENTGMLQNLPVYHAGSTADPAYNPDTDKYATIESMNKKLSQLGDITANAYQALTTAQGNFDSYNKPTFAGNTKLESLSELSEEEFAEIKQIIADMNANGVTSQFLNCFDSSLSIDADHYVGGIYKFNRDGVTYYTTYYDLAQAAYDSEFRNDIDNQPKMNYYHANYVEKEINTVDKAVLDTDSRGRFKTVRFASDGAQYTLNFEQKTDDAAYEDAMNKYYYENARYDKMIQDINAKTSIIQQEDRTLELKLKQLDTEQNALSNEIEAVQKVVKDNVEKSFKTFGG